MSSSPCLEDQRSADGIQIPLLIMDLITLTDECPKAEDIRFWHKADMGLCAANVRFRG